MNKQPAPFLDTDYFIYVCPVCDEIWCSDDPLLRTDPMDCSCGQKDVVCGLVESNM